MVQVVPVVGALLLLVSHDEVSIIIDRDFLLRVNDGCRIQLLDNCRTAEPVTRFERLPAIDLGVQHPVLLAKKYFSRSRRCLFDRAAGNFTG